MRPRYPTKHSNNNLSKIEKWLQTILRPDESQESKVDSTIWKSNSIIIILILWGIIPHNLFHRHQKIRPIPTSFHDKKYSTD